MSIGGVTLLGLPSVRGNPFDNRPIEASRSQDLVGQQKILHRWRDHIHSGSPRMIFLVGDPGSGRTSIINTISSQTPKKYIGQYLSGADDKVRTVLHEIVTHFGTFEPITNMNQLSQKLVSMFDEEKGPLPLIALDYPSQAIDLNDFLSRISPILSRLRAMIIVSLTESQFLDLNIGLKETFDEPDRIKNFTKKEIQEMVNNRMRLKSKEKWMINSIILDSIHTSTGGNPRDVIRILKRLVDEKRDLGCHGALENLVAWREDPAASKIQNIPQQSQTVNPEFSSPIIFDYEEIEVDEEVNLDISDNLNNDFVNHDPDEISRNAEVSDWSDDFSVDSNYDEEERFEDAILDLDKDIRTELIPKDKPNISASESNSNVINKTGLFMEPGTEPPRKSQRSGSFSGLRSRLAKTSSDMEQDNSNPVEITYADSIHPQSTLDKFTDPEIYKEPKIPTIYPEDIVSEAQVDPEIKIHNYNEVMITEGSEWSVEPSFSSTLPDIPIESKFDIEDSLPEKLPELISSTYVEDTIFEDMEPSIELPIEPIPTPIVPTIPAEIFPIENVSPNFSKFAPRWEPDLPLDTNRFYSLSDAERLILEIAAKREISPSDDELQARLEVGRPRLSQLYNSLQKSGLLSVRKQGRTRLFKLSSAAVDEF